MNDDGLSAARADAADAGLAALAGQVDAAMDAVMRMLPAAGDGTLAVPAIADTAGMVDVTRSLAEVAGALALCGQPGLAMMADELRAGLLAAIPAEAAWQPSLQRRAALLRQLLQHALALVLRGEPLTAGELLPAWRAFAQSDEVGDTRAAEFLALDPDPDVAPCMPEAEGDELIDAAHDRQADAERALLDFLRASDDAARGTAVAGIAPHLASVIRATPDPPACIGWQVMHAYVLEMTAGALLPVQRSKTLLAAIVRALRHWPQSLTVPASLPRQALFALAMTELQTDAGRQVARKFRLAQQFPPTLRPVPGNDNVAGGTGLAAGIDGLDAWIAEREASGDAIGSPASWQALAADCAGCAPLAALAAAMQSLLPHWAELQADRDAQHRLAACLLCIRAAAVAGDAGELTALARLLECVPLANASNWPAAIGRSWRVHGEPLLAHSLTQACIESLADSERQLDAATDLPALRAALDHARQSLQQLRGIAQLLAMPALPALIEELQSRLDATLAKAQEGGGEFALHLLAHPWAALGYRLATLHGRWSLPCGDPPPTRQPAHDHAGSELLRVFFDEASRLIARLRALQPLAGATPANATPSDFAEAIHSAHTLAGCSATAGLIPMSRLALALERIWEGQRVLAPALVDDALEALARMLAQFATDGQCEDPQALLDRLEAVEPQSETCTIDYNDDVTGVGMDTCTTMAAGTAVPEVPAPSLDAVGAGDAEVSAGTTDTSARPASLPPPVPDAAAVIEPDADQAELLTMFREELVDLLAQYEPLLQDWRRNPDQRTAAPALLRILHTLKGSARMAGQVALGEAFHACEAEVAAIAQLAPAAMRDRLDGLQAQLDQWLLEANLPRPAATQAVMPGLPVAQDELPNRRPASGQLRIPADALDGFADGLATLWLGHAGIADAVQEQRRIAAEFSDNLARLRGQLRELEIDAESRIMSSALPEIAGDFDPLELDRYTRLHEITRMIAESVADLGDIQRGLAQRLERLSQVSRVQRRELRQLQSALQRLRSQPFAILQPRLERLLRQAARDAGRDAGLEIAGGSVDVERTLLDRLAGPLEHLLRNALVHGIEPPDVREAAGKPRSGRIRLSVSQTASELHLSLEDDGRGLDLERIRERAAAVGLLSASQRQAVAGAGAEPEATTIGDLIFEPGFSTASEVTALSGRGIGLDAVRSELQALGGSIHVDSRAGQGCRFSITVPLLLATLPVLLVRCGRHRIAVPTTCLQRVLQLKAAAIERSAGCPAVPWEGDQVPVQPLAQLLGEPPASEPDGGYLTVAILQHAGRTIALQLEAVEGQQELVVKPPGPQLSRQRWLVGATQLGDGGIALIIDPFGLPATRRPDPAAPVSSDTRPLVLVVDDSLTVRRASQRLLERHGYAVALARDGMEALERLGGCLPAAVLLDIEMPRMDGFELLAALRDDVRLRALPVVMITSRIAERHRERAALLGVSGYLGKPFQEDALLALLARLCGMQRAGEIDPAPRPVTGDRDEDRLEEQPQPTRSAPAA